MELPLFFRLLCFRLVEERGDRLGPVLCPLPFRGDVSARVLGVTPERTSQTGSVFPGYLRLGVQDPPVSLPLR